MPLSITTRCADSAGCPGVAFAAMRRPSTLMGPPQLRRTPSAAVWTACQMEAPPSSNLRPCNHACTRGSSAISIALDHLEVQSSRGRWLIACRSPTRAVPAVPRRRPEPDPRGLPAAKAAELPQESFSERSPPCREASGAVHWRCTPACCGRCGGAAALPCTPARHRAIGSVKHSGY